MPNYQRGDVVLVDMGMAGKVRMCVVVSIARPDSQRNMSVIVPITSEIRNSETKSALASRLGCGNRPW